MNQLVKPDTKVSFTVVDILMEFLKAKNERKEPVTYRMLETRAARIFTVTEAEIIKTVNFMVEQKVVIDANESLTTSLGLEATYVVNPELRKRKGRR